MSMMNDVGVTVSDNDLRVNPGEEVKLTITVHNDGTIIDMFRIEVEGLNEQWDWPEVLAHRLTPHLGSPARPHGDCMFESVLAISPPRNSSAGAGLHSFKVKVARDHNPLEETIVPVELEVRPFHSFALDLSPQRVTAAQALILSALPTLATRALTLTSRLETRRSFAGLPSTSQPPECFRARQSK
jgi:hypothetical protein